MLCNGPDNNQSTLGWSSTRKEGTLLKSCLSDWKVSYTHADPVTASAILAHHYSNSLIKWIPSGFSSAPQQACWLAQTDIPWPVPLLTPFFQKYKDAHKEVNSDWYANVGRRLSQDGCELRRDLTGKQSMTARLLDGRSETNQLEYFLTDSKVWAGFTNLQKHETSF